MGKKAIIALFCISAQLCAAKIVYMQERPTDKVKSAVMQGSYTTIKGRTLVYLDDNSAWLLCPCKPIIHTYCEHYRETYLPQVDPRFNAGYYDWKGVHNVDVYNYPFEVSEAAKILSYGIPYATHLLVNTETNTIAFAFPATKQIDYGYKVYGPGQIKEGFDDLIGGDSLRESIERSLQNPMLIQGPRGSGRKTLVRALAKEKNKILIEVDLSVEENDYMDAVDANRGAFVMFHGSATDEFSKIFKAYDIKSKKIPETLIEKITFLTEYFEAHCFVITDKEASLEAPNFSEFTMPVVTFEQSERFFTDLLNGYPNVDRICQLTKGCTFGTLKEIGEMAKKKAAKDGVSHISYDDLLALCKKHLYLKAQAATEAGALSLSDPREAIVTFKDIGGCSQAKEDMKEVIAFLKNPKLYGKLGVKPPKGVLCLGPPGCGKTLLAKAVAGEANCSFFYCSGSELQGYYVNENIVLIKQAFEQARANAPAILFIDEIDAIGGKRSNRDSSSASMYAHGVNQLLSEMDGFQSADGVVVMGATNFAESLDPALVRPGRFDRKISIGYPNLKERQEILEIHAKKRFLNAEIDMNYLARICIGMSGADLESMVNEAALSAGREQRTSVTLSDLQDARDRVLMGRENKSLILTEKEKRDTAYHEAGHTVVGLYLDCSLTVDKVTITPRGLALGITWSVPEGEHVQVFKSKLKADLAMKLGGYAAEKMFLHDTTAGVSNDLQTANQLARSMVCKWGMSDALGFLVDHENASPETKRLIDVEVQRLLDEAYAEACTVLEEHRSVVEQIVDELLEKEMLYREDLDRIMAEHA
ncbi:MAG: AAA family ATPase [Chlamydiia bacterium]|nr:AAA family ATPase [Chlamydiia bacterium]